MISGTLPRITVVTPSFNQAGFLEKTIRSVVEQDYPDLEYFVVDGGSTDGSRQILERNSRYISWWTSETDLGQAHAINKGFRRATGQVLCWLNSDDCFAPGALQFVGQRFGNGIDALAGHCLRINVTDQSTILLRGQFVGYEGLLRFWLPYSMHQPSIFWRREITERIGLLDESLHYALDYEYWLRIARHYSFENADRTLSHSHLHARAKTADDWRYHRERRRVAWREVRRMNDLARRRFVLDFIAHGLGYEAAFFLRPAVPLRLRKLLRDLR